MIKREKETRTINQLVQTFPVVGIIGARQVGKTTLAGMVAKESTAQVTRYDLENPEDLARLADPMLALKELKGLVIIDEIQMYPDLFSILRVLADRPGTDTRFLILGSASPELLRQGAESLAGRIIFHELKGLSIEEVGVANFKKLWLRGGFPLSYLGKNEPASMEWRRAFIKTFLERDLPQLGINIRSATMRRFWTMLAHYHGQTWNASEFSRSFGVADTTIRNYLDLLTSALVVRQLPPWHENIAKRQVKAPKIYISDSGLVHSLLNINNMEDLESHPKMGATWEGFVLDQIIRIIGADSEECFFWATHAGAELDLMIVRGRQRLGFEIKRTTSPAINPSMRHAMSDLKLDRIFVVHAGETTFSLSEKIIAVAFTNILNDLSTLT